MQVIFTCARLQYIIMFVDIRSCRVEILSRKTLFVFSVARILLSSNPSCHV